MTLLEQRPPRHAPTTYARRAWIALAFVPVGLVVAIVASMAGERAGHGVSGAVGGALIGVLSLAAPTLAVIFAGRAVAAGEPTGRASLTVSAALLVATVILLPLAVVGAVGWLIALAVTVAVVGSYFAVRYRRQVTVNPPTGTVDKRPEGPLGHPVRSARWAWVAVAFSPLGLIVAIVAMFAIAGLAGVDLWSPDPLTTAESIEIGAPSMLVALACPLLGVVLGARSARSGNRSGMTAAIVAAAILVLLATWWLLTAF